MKAVVLDAYNPEERLQVADDWPCPVRRKGEVLVRVVATAVNRSVYKTATGFLPRFLAKLPKVGSTAWVIGTAVLATRCRTRQTMWQLAGDHVPAQQAHSITARPVHAMSLLWSVQTPQPADHHSRCRCPAATWREK